MYITSMSSSQLGEAAYGRCDVEVKWAYGNQLPDRVQLHFLPSGAVGSSYILGNIDRDADETKEGSAVVKLPAPIIGTLSVCPRMLQDGEPVDMQPDEGGVATYWETFCFAEQIVTKGVEEPVEKGCQNRPVIDAHPIEGAIEVHWTKHKAYDRYELFWAEGKGPEHRVRTEDTHFTLERTRASELYTFRVRGCIDRLLWVDGCCSEPSDPVVVVVPEHLGYMIPKFAEKASLAAISRSPNNMDVFAVGDDGQLRSTWWDGAWHMWFRIGDPILMPGAPLAALTRDDDFMDIFAQGQDGRIQVAWWNGNPWRAWAPIGDAVFPPETPIGAVSRHSDFMDIFAVGPDGKVYQAWWNGNGWQSWFPIGNELFSPGTPIAALSRNDDHMELFAIGRDGAIRGNWWDGQWHDWYRLDGAMFPQRGHIGVIRRDDDHMDIFAIGEDGVLYHNWWDGQWRGWWWQTDQDFPPGSPLAAQSRHRLHMEVFAIGVDHRVYTAWWDGGWHAWFPVLGNPPRDMAFYPSVAAVTRNDMQLDIFAISRQQEEEFVLSNWWHASWKQWFILR